MAIFNHPSMGVVMSRETI